MVIWAMEVIGASGMTPACRLCGSHELRRFLGVVPRCELFLTPEAAVAPDVAYPVQVRVRERCLLVQLPPLITPEETFTEYPYFSSYSRSRVEQACCPPPPRTSRAQPQPPDRVVRQPPKEAVPVPMPVLRPITDADLDAVARFFHVHHNSDLPVEAYRRSFVAHRGAHGANHGVMLVDGDDVVGAYIAYYSDRVIDGRMERFCNLASWCVRPEHRRHSLRMANALLAQEGLHFTDLSPSGTVRALNERLGFTYLDDRAVIVPAAPWPRRPGSISADPHIIEKSLVDEECQLYRDHRDAPAAHHLVLRDGASASYVVLRIARRKMLQVAIVLHASRPEMLRRMIRSVAGFALLHHRVVALLVELRWLSGTAPAGLIPARLPPKMFRSPTLGPDDIDYFYSELFHLQW
jgi:hypothetical protein